MKLLTPCYLLMTPILILQVKKLSGINSMLSGK